MKRVGESDPLEGQGLVERRKLFVALFLLWLSLVVGALTWPWSNFDATFHWHRVVWSPFGERILNCLDIFLNLVLFLPFGFLGLTASKGNTWKGVLVFTFAGFLLSAAGELLQGFSLRRFPSATDVFANTLGALSGSLLAWGCPHLLGRKSCD